MDLGSGEVGENQPWAVLAPGSLGGQLAVPLPSFGFVHFPPWERPQGWQCFSSLAELGLSRQESAGLCLVSSASWLAPGSPLAQALDLGIGRRVFRLRQVNTC